MSKSGFEFIKEETRRRCKIIQLDAKEERRYITLHPENFHFLYDAANIDFTVYFRIENTMIEYIKANEFSKELLDQVWSAMQGSDLRLEIAILKSQYQNFINTIELVRNSKINKLLESDPNLDRKVIDIFSNLSGASSLVVKGGITNEVANRVKASAAYMVNNLMDNQMAIATLSRMVTHDPTLYDHSASVAMMAGMIARQCLPKPMPNKEIELVTQCGLYHDVGKTCIPSKILNKPGEFTDEEFAVMKEHAPLGEEELLKVINEGAHIDPIAARVAGEHHERFSGTGYPRKRKGRFEEDPENGIHLYSRIVTIADVYSALLMKRVYKPAYEAQDAIKIMAKVAKAEYDPVIFSNFIKQVVHSLNTFQEKINGKDQGRLLFFDGDGQLREQKRKVI